MRFLAEKWGNLSRSPLKIITEYTLPLKVVHGTYVTNVYSLFVESSSSFLFLARRTLTLYGTLL